MTQPPFQIRALPPKISEILTQKITYNFERPPQLATPKKKSTTTSLITTSRWCNESYSITITTITII